MSMRIGHPKASALIARSAARDLGILFVHMPTRLSREWLEAHPPGEQTGGLTGKADISLEMGPTAHSWLTRGPTDVHRRNPTTL
jgi:hypothetical protein